MKKTDDIFRLIVEFLEGRVFLYASLLLFSLQATLLSITLKVGLPPDEYWHLGLVKLYARDGFDPFIQNQSGYYFLGDVTRTTGFLYHYSLSFLYRFIDLIGLERFSVQIMRLTGVLLGLLTLVVISKIAKELNLPKAVGNSAVFLMANTAMFVFISAAVNYDNLVIFLSAATILYLVKSIKKPSLSSLTTLFIMIGAGCLTKITFLPLALLVVVCLLISWFWDYRKNLNLLMKDFKKANRKNVILMTILAPLLILGSVRLVTNAHDYKSINPTCTQIHTLDQCKQYPVFKRNLELSQNKSKPGLLNIQTFSVRWFILMQQRTFAVFAHKSYHLPKLVVMSIFSVYFMWLVAFIRKVKFRDRALLRLLAIAASYYAILLLVNWSSYRDFGVFGLALQGRYALPVMYLFYITGMYYLWVLSKKYTVKAILYVVVMAVFFFSSLPIFVTHVDRSWFWGEMDGRAKTSTVNNKV